MTRNTNFVILSFGVVDSKSDNVLSAKGNHSLGVVKGNESYELLNQAFGDIFNQINHLNKLKHIKVGEKIVNLEIFFGGDYKFLLLVFGLQNATSNYSCLWCKVHKDKRWDMSHDISYYTSVQLKRSIKDIHDLAGKSKNNYCCVARPLVEIDLDHVICDELHLMLRVVDVLIDNLMEDVLEWDKTEDMCKKRSDERGIHLNNLISTIRSCGVSFNIWQKKSAEGNASGKYECTSLLSHDKKILLQQLPRKLSTAIQEDSCSEVIQIWQDFYELYKTINKEHLSEEEINNYFDKAKAWVKLFISLSPKRKGYNKSRVTPYLHIMVYHVPQFLRLFKTMRIFSGQGVEKNNDVARSTVLRKSNKLDSTSDVLKLEFRQRQLREQERNKRTYEKVDGSYWESEIFKKRQKRRLDHI
ncbi:Hypothetical predicted protein [Paramuricea clavata]|uniref:Uncharacterized protein n=1 Tax=Paramuricea clavata TaxID=317549 RepID=A0A6S7KQH2_PARCT|nr:Hypothetical predicted protein [Paramuricea clavata]